MKSPLRQCVGRRFRVALGALLRPRLGIVNDDSERFWCFERRSTGLERMALSGGRWFAAVSIALLNLLVIGRAQATPALVVDVDSGVVLYETMATAPWFPASLTKLMTTYVALSAVREGRITMDTPLMVSPRAAAMAPSKMGFRPGTLVTLDNALKMLMVKSPNDVAVTVAEGVGGSVEAFADEMNTYAARLGLHESHFVNPNGLPDPNHVSSARDMAIIARALLREFPEEHDLFGIGDLAFGRQLIHNHNGMLGRYPGVDGMKTGYTCSAGYNVVLSAQRNDRRLITVVLGAPSNTTRSLKAAALFDKYFGGESGNEGQLASLASAAPSAPPDLRSVICGRGRANAIAEAEAEDASITPSPPAQFFGFAPKNAAMEVAGTAPATTGPNVLQLPRAAFVPVRVFVGPVEGWTGPVAHAKSTGTAVASAPPPLSTAANQPTEPPLSGPTESPAPAPMALLGATAPVPASLMNGFAGKKARRLSLAVGSSPRRKIVIHKVDPKLARGTTPSILAGSGAASPEAKPTRSAPKVAAAQAKAIKPKAKVEAQKTSKSE